MNVMQEVQDAHNRIIIEIETAFAELIQSLEDNSKTNEKGLAGNYETVYPMTVNPAVFKGKKPTAVTFGNERVGVRTWKMVVEEIMRRCDADPEKHVALMNLRSIVSGRKREYLSKEESDMRSPIKIAENLYFETHYDTETLLRILKTHILDGVDYDYSNIMVATRTVNPHKN